MENYQNQHDVKNQYSPLGQWDADFKSHGIQYSQGPVKNRNVTDPICVGVFFVFLLGFLSLGGYFISGLSTVIQIHTAHGQAFNMLNISSEAKGTFAGIAIGCIFLSLILSIGFIFVAKAFPKFTVWGLIIMTILLFVVLSILGFIFGSLQIGLVFICAAAIYTLTLFCCLRKHIDTSIILVKCTGEFLTSRLQVLVFGLVIGLTIILFSIYWALGYIGKVVLSSFGVQLMGSGFHILQAIYWALYLFFTFFFYFSTVFVVGSAVGLWYYRQDQDGIVCKSFKWLTYHIGSITFASVVITAIRLLRSMVSKESSNPGLRLCFLLLSCIFQTIEYYLKILNHYATISMAYTGQGYIDSAKSAGVLIFNNLGLFATVDFITGFFFYGSFILCVGFPTALSGILCYSTHPNDSPVAFMVITVLIFSLLISTCFLTIFTDSLSAILLFFCMDKKLTEMGITKQNCPEEIRNLLNDVANRQVQHVPQETLPNVQ